MWRHGLIVVVVLASSCGTRSSPSHEAYVWQRAWTGAVKDAVETAPAELTGLRVLALEVDPAGRLVFPDVGMAALAQSRRSVTAVIRVGGSRPLPQLSFASLWSRINQWRVAGVDVVGIEIDHDCATARLADYADWLRKMRPPHPYRLSITALPTWMESPLLERVVAAVDDVVLQVHAVSAPSLFVAAKASAWVYRFSELLDGRTFRVALPTYRVAVNGTMLAAQPAELSRFVQTLTKRRVNGLTGIVWFRLPVGIDRATWSTRTLCAVIRGEPLAARADIGLVANAPDRYDIVLTNHGTVAAAWPSIRLDGVISAADLVGGYTPQVGQRWQAPGRLISPGATLVVGWVNGRSLSVETN